ncbi:MAG: VOC family protein [Acidobacteriota bacterium]|nr:VOC family protein [Acidobacteriota bacterium]
MTDFDAHAPGMPVWVDAMVPTLEKLAALKEFLTGVFAWDWQHGEADTGYYSIATHRGRAVLGLGQMDGTAGTLVTYFATDDVAASVARAEAHGATVIIGATPILELGQMALLKDPAGVVHGLWQAGDFTGFGALYEVGAPGWFDHVSAGPEAAAHYYRELTGHSLIEPEPGLRVLCAGEQWFASISSPQVLAGQAHWNPIYLVSSLEAARDAVLAGGGRVLVEEMAVPGSAISAFVEPVCHNVIVVMRPGVEP